LVEEIDDTKDHIDSISGKVLEEINNTRPQLQEVKRGCDEARQVLRIPSDVHNEVLSFGRGVRAVKIAAQWLAKIPITLMKVILMPLATMCTLTLHPTKSILKVTKKADEKARAALRQVDKVERLVEKCDRSLGLLQKGIPEVQDCVAEFAASASRKQKELQDAAENDNTGRGAKALVVGCMACASNKYIMACKDCLHALNRALEAVDWSCGQICKYKEEVNKVAKDVNAKIQPAREAMRVANQTTQPFVDPIKSAVQEIQNNSAITALLDTLSMIESVLSPVFEAVLRPLAAPLQALAEQCNPVKQHLEQLEKSIKEQLMGDLMKQFHETTSALNSITMLQATFDKHSGEYKANAAKVGIDTVIKSQLKELEKMVAAEMHEQLSAAAEVQMERLRGDLRHRCNAEALFEALGIGGELPAILGSEAKTSGAADHKSEALELSEKVVEQLEKRLLSKLEQMYNDLVNKMIDDLTDPDKILAACEEGAKLAKGKKRLTRKGAKKAAKAEVAKAMAKAKEEMKAEATAVEKEMREEAEQLLAAELHRQKEQLIKDAKREAMLMAMEALTREINSVLVENNVPHAGMDWGDALSAAVDVGVKVFKWLNAPQDADSEVAGYASTLEENDQELDGLLDGKLDAWPH